MGARDGSPTDAWLPPLLETRLAAARAAWPGVEVSEAALGAYLAERCAPSPGDAPERALDALHLEDLYLACACANGDPRALAAFEAAFFPDVKRVLARMDPSGILGDEVQQLLRQKLFLAAPGQRPQIAEYSGRGSLKRWLRVVATRVALNARRGVRREEPTDEAELLALPAADGDPELEHFRRHYGEEFQRALEQALGALSVRERNLMRQHYVDQLDLDALAALYKVHRVTVFRWLTQARRTLEAVTRQSLSGRLGVGSRSLDSIVRLVQSQLNVSLSRLLGRTE